MNRLHPGISMRPRVRRKSFARGLSLVEILIALTIGAVAFYPIITLFQSGVKDSIYATSWTQARELAKSYTDKLLALNFDDLTVATKPTVDGIPNYFPKVDKVKNVEYTTDCVIEDITPEFEYRTVNRAGVIMPEPNRPPSKKQVPGKLKKIKVTIKWKGVGATLEYKVATLKSDLHKGTIEN